MWSARAFGPAPMTKTVLFTAPEAPRGASPSLERIKLAAGSRVSQADGAHSRDHISRPALAATRRPGGFRAQRRPHLGQASAPRPMEGLRCWGPIELP